MSSKREKIMDDVARAAGSAIGIFGGLAGQAKSSLRTRIDTLAHDMDLVPREDFERLELMLVKSREELQTLKSRLDALESELINSKKKK